MPKATGSIKKTKGAKDPNAPKRPLSSYFLWLAENRNTIKKPGMTLGEVGKAAGALWKTIEDKSKWEKLAAEAKMRYEQEMAEYNK